MKWRNLGLVFVVNTLGGVSPALFMWLANPRVGIGELLHRSRFGMVYAWCIGTLCFFAMELIARWIRRRLNRVLQAPAFLFAFVMLAMAGSLPATLLFVAFGWIEPSELWTAYRQGVLVAIAFTVVIGSIVVAFEIVRHRLDAATIELRNRQLAEERARKLATEARLTSLQSRVHPHFLFNTLNSISALIREDPGAAERTVERLAALLREGLDMDRNRLVPLHRELRVVENYLEIERTRYGGRLRYHIDVPSLLLELEVPPFCLQTLVENSVKHVVSARREGAEIWVTGHGESGRAVLEVVDDGPGFDRASFAPGHGLDNLQDRLTALFDGAGHLQTERRDGRAVVSLTVPMSRVAV